MTGLDDGVEGIRGRFDLVEGLELGPFSRSAYQSMLGQSGGVVRRPFYAGGTLHLSPFAIALPEERLLELIGTRRSELSLGGDAGRLDRYSGMAARDGSESYALSSVDLIFEDYSDLPRPDLPEGRATNFMIYFDIRVGKPIPETFIQANPADRSRQRFWASLQVLWDRFWPFFVASTKPFSLALRERVLAAHGFDVGPPPYTVTDGR